MVLVLNQKPVLFCPSNGKDGIVLGWILSSSSQELYISQVYSEISYEVLKKLKETYDKMDRSMIFNLMHKINSLKDGDLYI